MRTNKKIAMRRARECQQIFGGEWGVYTYDAAGLLYIRMMSDHSLTIPKGAKLIYKTASLPVIDAD